MTDQNQNPATPRFDKVMSDAVDRVALMKEVRQVRTEDVQRATRALQHLNSVDGPEGIPACEIIEPLRPDQIRPVPIEWEGSGYNPEQCERLVKLFYENGKTIASLRAELETVRAERDKWEETAFNHAQDGVALRRKLDAVRPLIGEMRHEIVGSDYHTADSCLHCKVLAILDALPADPAG